MMKILFLILTILLITSGSLQAQEPKLYSIYFKRANDYFERVKKEFGQQKSDNKKCVLYKDSCIFYYTECLKFLENHDSKESLKKQKTLKKISQVYRHFKNFDSALVFYNKYFHEIKEQVELNPYKYSDILHERAIISQEGGKYDNAYKDFKKSIQIDSINICSIINCSEDNKVNFWGEVSKKVSNYKNNDSTNLRDVFKQLANSYFYLGAIYFERAKNECGQQKSENKKCVLYKDSCIFYYTECLEFLENHDSKESQKKKQEVLEEISQVYRHFKNFDSALVFYKKYFYEKEKEVDSNSYEYSNILKKRAIISQEAGKYDNAYKDFKKSIQIDSINICSVINCSEDNKVNFWSEISEKVSNDKNKDSTILRDVLKQLANSYLCLGLNKEYRFEYITSLENNLIAEKILENIKNVDYPIILNNIGVIYTKLNDFNNAEKYLKKSIEERKSFKKEEKEEKEYDENCDQDLAMYELKTARLYGKFYKIEEAKIYYYSAKNKFEKFYKKEFEDTSGFSRFSVMCINELGKTYLEKSKKFLLENKIEKAREPLKEAIKHFTNAKKIHDKSFNKILTKAPTFNQKNEKDALFSKIFMNISDYYLLLVENKNINSFNNKNFIDSIFFYLDTTSYFIKKIEKNGLNHSKIHQRIAQAYYSFGSEKKGYYKKSEENYKEAIKYYDKNEYGQKTQNFLDIKFHLALLNHQFYLQESDPIQKDKFLNNALEYFKEVHLLIKENTIYYFVELDENQDEYYWYNHKIYIDSINDFCALHHEKLNELKSLFYDNILLSKSTLLESNIIKRFTSTANSNLEYLEKKSLKLHKAYNSSHTEENKKLIGLSLIKNNELLEEFEKLKRLKKGLQNLPPTKIKDAIENLKKIQSQTLFYKQKEDYEVYSSKINQDKLKLKLIEKRLRKTIQENIIHFSENYLSDKKEWKKLDSMISDFDKYNRIQKKIVLYEKALEDSNNISFNEFTEYTDSVNIIDEKLTKDLNSFHRQILDNRFETTWELVKESLDSTEVAIEFAKYFDSKDRIYKFMALLVRPQYDYPKLVLLEGDEDEIAELIKNQDQEFPALYALVWKPIEEYLTGVKRVFYSPAGQLNNLSFSALCMGERKELSLKKNKDTISIETALDQTSRSNILNGEPLNDSSSTFECEYLMDRYELQQLTTTRYISDGTLKKIKETEMDAIITLVGGVYFDSIPIAYSEKKEYANRSFQNTSNKEFGYLKGSRIEVDKIAALFEKKEWILDTLIGKTAEERKFKEEVQKNKPGIIHIATHGFAYPDRKKDKRQQLIGTDVMSYSASEDPMLRCGLAFTGANKSWMANSRKMIDETGEDGILTAAEVSNLNLSKTKLVVLSACQTGLGKIEGSEGTFGLKRGFKLAGVEQMIVSLWKVDDEKTMELMTLFYEDLTQSLNPVISFEKAQKQMRESYPTHPDLWAAFVLVR